MDKPLTFWIWSIIKDTYFTQVYSRHPHKAQFLLVLYNGADNCGNGGNNSKNIDEQRSHIDNGIDTDRGQECCPALEWTYAMYIYIRLSTSDQTIHIVFCVLKSVFDTIPLAQNTDINTEIT